MRSSLAPFLPNTMNCHRIKKEAWLNEGILVIVPEQMKHLSQKEYETIKNIGNRLYRGNV